MNEKNKEEVNVLDELHKGACMGEDAINFIIDKIHSKDFKELLNNQLQEYKDIASEIEEVYPEYSQKKPHETSAMNKVMTWYGIEMKTMVDDTDSKLAELLMQGTNMGIIEGRRLLNDNNCPQEINSLLSKYVDMQEQALENLKPFL